MFGFVYLWYDRKTKRYYIGSHKGTPNDSYICSSSWMKSAYKRRPKDFKRRILSTVHSNKTDLLNAEQRYLNMIKEEELGKKYYNLKKSAHGGFSPNAIKASAESRTGKPLTQEHKEKLRNNLKNKQWSDSRRKSQRGKYTRSLKIKYKDMIFDSKEEAIKYIGKSRATIDRWCADKNNLEWSKFYDR